jgi:GGDEF domain-containing protein
VARQLEAVVRRSDLVARIGSDEFVVALCALESADTARFVAAKIVSTLARPIELGDDGQVVTSAPASASSTRRRRSMRRRSCCVGPTMRCATPGAPAGRNSVLHQAAAEGRANAGITGRARGSHLRCHTRTVRW